MKREEQAVTGTVNRKAEKQTGNQHGVRYFTADVMNGG